MAVVVTVKAGDELLALVHFGIESRVAVNIGEDQHGGGLGDEHAVADDRQAHGGLKAFFLDEHVAAIGGAVAVGILDDHDPVAGGALAGIGRVVHPLDQPEPALRRRSPCSPGCRTAACAPRF